MALIYAQNVIEIAFHHTYTGRPVVNVLHIANDEAAASDSTKARDVVNNWQDHMMDNLDGQLVFNEATWRSLDPDDTNQGTITPDPAKAMAGGRTGTGLPPNVAVLVKKVTSNRQRGQRDGRIFLGGVPAADVGESGGLIAAARTAWATALDAFLDGVNDDAFGVGGGSGLVVLNTTPESRLPGNTPVTLTHRPVTSLVLDPLVSTQRDRLR